MDEKQYSGWILVNYEPQPVDYVVGNAPEDGFGYRRDLKTGQLLGTVYPTLAEAVEQAEAGLNAAIEAQSLALRELRRKLRRVAAQR